MSKERTGNIDLPFRGKATPQVLLLTLLNTLGNAGEDCRKHPKAELAFGEGNQLGQRAICCWTCGKLMEDNSEG